MATPNSACSRYEILGLVGREGAGPHDLLRMAQRGRMLAWAGESQYYTEPKRLAKLGYLSARKEPGKTRERTVYTLTEKGLEALREYARTPVTFTPLKSDALLRLLICDLVGEEVTRESMATLRDDIADIAARLDDAERSARGSSPTARSTCCSSPASCAAARAARGTRRRGRARAQRTGHGSALGSTGTVGRDGPRSAMKSPSIPHSGESVIPCDSPGGAKRVRCTERAVLAARAKQGCRSSSASLWLSERRRD